MAKNKKKTGKSQKARSQKKILDAFTIAERSAGREDGGESDNDSDDLQVRDGVMDARKFLKDDADDSFDDEELDSDEALGLGDEYDVLNLKFSQTIRDKKKRKGYASEDEGYLSIDESQLVTLSEAWDMDERDRADALDSDGDTKSGDIVLDERDDSDDSDSETADSESESGSESESESEDEEQILRGDDDDAEVDMAATLSNIGSYLKEPREYRRLVTERTDENEYSVPTAGARLSMAEMLAAADPEDAPLISRDDDAKPLAVPLPKRIQQRHERTAAYEITKEEVKKWEDLVRAIRDADHLLFPLAPPATAEEQDEVDAEAEVDARQFVPAAEPMSALELKVNSLLLAGALLDESKEATFEQIAAAKLSKEDLFKRTQELRRMRELMFRDEQRAKRIKKIKSKQFRKIRKKDRLRDADLVEGSDESDPDDHAVKRAEERMSLRHKTQSKWAQSIIKSGITKDALTRAELEEMLRNGERLRAKQLGYEEGDQSDDNVSDIEREYANDNEAAEDEERGLLGKGVLAMDFMKAAEERRRKENKKEMEFIKNMGSSGIDEFASEKNSINQLKNQGRRVYAPSAAAAVEEMEELEEDVLRDFRDDEAKSLDNRLRGKEREQDEEPPAKKQKVEEEEFNGFEDSDDDKDESDADAENPWLTVGADEATTKRSNKISAITQDSSRLSKAAGKIQKIADKRKGSAKQPETFIDLDKVLAVSGNVHASEDEDEGEDRAMFRQQNLIKEAFAGDDVVAEFDAEKRQMAEDEDDKEEDLTLPGWGGWAGGSEPQKPKKKFVRKIDGVVQKDKRRDKNLKNVIINETVNKHNLKYQSSSVPFPYELKEQYERALRMPLGDEWTSRATHQKVIRPRVEVKQGVVVDPLKAPFK